MRTPFLGPAYIGRSTDIVDSQLINLFPELIETKNGKEIGSFYMTPGLRLLATCGTGPIRGEKAMGYLLYVVSGNQVYSVTSSWGVTLIGSIATSVGPVSMITNGMQLQIFDGVNGYVLPGGQPLTGGMISVPGANYAIGDTIYLLQSGGTQNGTAQITVTGLGANNGVAGFTITGTGAFTGSPSSFSQQSTSGAGSGFVMISPTFGTFQGIYIAPLPFSGPVSASYQEGFGLVNESGTNVWWQSNLFDLSVYEPLNFSSADGLPSNVVAIREIHLEEWLFKTDSVEIWINQGTAGFSFARLAGPFIEVGCAAPFSVAKAGETLIWLTLNSHGQGQVMMARGYNPQRVSTHSQERSFAQYPTISDAIGFAYQQEGHLFYQITFPSGNATWVIDLTETEVAGFPVWHQRAAFSNGAFSRHWANAYTFFAATHVVGDYSNGNIYAYDLDTQTDNGTQRKWLRTWRALPKPNDEPMRFDSLVIDCQNGIGVPPGSNPQMMLRWSDDGGHNWSNQKFSSAGQTGQTSQRTLFTRMGSTRINSGLDRIFELSMTDPMSVCLIGAVLN